jgi:hypothetical protein
MSWFSVLSRMPLLAVAMPIAIVAAIWIAAVYDYRLEIDAIGLRFDKPVVSSSVKAIAINRAQP